MSALDVAAVPLLLAAAFFFLSGTVGLLRFPDLYTRLHALTKADNLGLGLVALALALRSGSLAAALENLLVWALALLASSTSCHLVARAARAAGVPAARAGDPPASSRPGSPPP